MFKDVSNLPVVDNGVTLGLSDIEDLIQRQLKTFSTMVAVRQQLDFDSPLRPVPSVPAD